MEDREPGADLLGEREEVELERRACGGRASRLPRGGGGSRRAPPSTPTRCRRCAAASGAFSLPRQYAPATFVSLNAPSRFVRGTCGPRQRSTNSAPSGRGFLYSEITGPSPISPVSSGSTRSMISRLYGWSVEDRERVVAVDLLALERLVGLHDLPHARLDALEVVLARSAAPSGSVEVVVEAVLDRRTDGVLGARVEVGDGLRHHVRGGVPQHLAAVGRVGGDDGDGGVVVDRPGRGRPPRRRPWPRPRPWRGLGRWTRRCRRRSWGWRTHGSCRREA